MKTIIRYKPAANGYETIYLDTCIKGKRRYDMLGLKVKCIPKSAEEKHQRREKENLAKEIAKQLELDLMKGKYHIEKKVDTAVDFVEFANTWIDETEGIMDIRVFRSAVNKLKQFGGNVIYCYEIDQEFLIKFYNFLKSSLNGVTPHNYMKKIRRIIKAAKKSNHFFDDPTEDLKLKKGKCADKECLTFDEIKTLFHTPCSNQLVKRASLFACNTGLRFCDIICLKWSNINDNRLNIVQAKTKVPVTIILNDDALALAGVRKASTDLIFPLGSHTGVLKSIKKWVKDAGITKAITFHCFRVSFATNLITMGCDVAITSKMLGHTSLVNTERYIRVSEMLKQTAIEKFPSIVKS